jgi:hypothetical protein
MDNKLLNKAITISAREEKLQGGKPVVKIKDEKGLTYTVYKLKQDGSTSIAWDQLRELVVGDIVQVSYVEEIKDSPTYGKVTYRTIRNFSKDIGNGMKNAGLYQTAPQTQKPRSGQNFSSQKGSNDAFGQKIGYSRYGQWDAGGWQYTRGHQGQMVG